MEQVRMRIDRRRDADTLQVTMMMSNGVQIPLELPEAKLPGVVVGRSYDCDWSGNGEWLNIRPPPPPTLTPEDEQRLETLFRQLKGTGK